MKIKFNFNYFFCLLFSFLLFFSQLLSRLDTQEIEAVACQHFSTLPSFLQVVNSQNSGRFFEMESALYLQNIGENIEGFDLDIELLYDVEQICFNNQTFELRRTEFDVITEHSVIECKNKNSISSKDTKQFLKEKTMLEWLQLVAQDLDHRSFRKSIQNNIHGRHFLVIDGNSTSNRPIALYTSWITALDEDTFINQWCNLIRSLAQKTFIVFLKNPIEESLQSWMGEHDINFRAGISC